jgi:hypothetical protein
MQQSIVILSDIRSHFSPLNLPRLSCELAGEAPPFRRTAWARSSREQENQLISPRFPTSVISILNSSSLNLFCIDRNNGIADTLNSDARCRVTIHSSPGIQKLSNIVSKVRRCCSGITSTKACRCLSRRVSYVFFFDPSRCSRAVRICLQMLSRVKFASTSVANAISL